MFPSLTLLDITLWEDAVVYFHTCTCKVTAFIDIDPPTLSVRAFLMETSFNIKETSRRA
jgi:hypothetical protein